MIRLGRRSPPGPRQRRVLGLLLALLVLLTLALAIPLNFIHGRLKWANATLAELEPRHARLLGLEHKAAEIDQSRAQAAAALRAQVYPASIDSDRAGSELQQRLRRLAEELDLSILGSQITTVPAAAQAEGGGEAFERIRVNIKLETDLAGLQELLDSLAAQRPAIHVASLNLQPLRGRGGSQAAAGWQLNVELGLLVFRLLE